MKYVFVIFIALLSIIAISCNVIKPETHQQLIAENNTLKDSLTFYKEQLSDTPEAVFELEKMNIVYRGIKNPIKIVVPNSTHFSAMAPGLKYIGNNRFELRPQFGKEVTIRIVAQMKNGEELKFSKVFRIENIGNPIGIIIGEKFSYALVKLTRKELIESTFSFDIYNFSHFRNLNVSKFDIRFPDNTISKVLGNTLNKEAIQKLRKLKIGDSIFVYNIRGFGYNGTRLKKIRPFYVEITEK